jgi:ribosome-associated protein
VCKKKRPWLTGGIRIVKNDAKWNRIVEGISNVLDDKQAADITVIDVSKFSPITDYFIIATSTSTPQTRALTRAVDEGLEKLGYKALKWQGKIESNWLILDLGSVIVHIMGAEERKRYSLEEIWEKTAITYHI